jgi:protein-S-isoprenylcysteine O-methyltransferase Ste14
MGLFFIPLVLGFASNLASAFTTAYSRRLGERGGSIVTVLLRDVFGIPVWAFGFVLASRTSAPPFFASSRVTDLVAWLTVTAGGVIILLSLVTIRKRAFSPSANDAMVQSGLYAHVRHPIHSGTVLEFFGLFLLRPNWAVAAACATGVVWVLVQTRFEEMDLLRRVPDYRAYMNRVPRFLPRFRAN